MQSIEKELSKDDLIQLFKGNTDDPELLVKLALETLRLNEDQVVQEGQSKISYQSVDFRDPSIVEKFVLKHNLDDHASEMQNMPAVIITTDEIQYR